LTIHQTPSEICRHAGYDAERAQTPTRWSERRERAAAELFERTRLKCAGGEAHHGAPERGGGRMANDFLSDLEHRACHRLHVMRADGRDYYRQWLD
jgi:hypothetical protein